MSLTCLSTVPSHGGSRCRTAPGAQATAAAQNPGHTPQVTSGSTGQWSVPQKSALWQLFPPCGSSWSWLPRPKTDMTPGTTSFMTSDPEWEAPETETCCSPEPPGTSSSSSRKGAEWLLITALLFGPWPLLRFWKAHQNSQGSWACFWTAPQSRRIRISEMHSGKYPNGHSRWLTDRTVPALPAPLPRLTLPRTK